MTTCWRYDVSTLQDIIASYIAGLVGPRAYAANHGDFICEIFNAQLTPYVDFSHGDLYEYVLSFNTNAPSLSIQDNIEISLEAAENLVGHLKYIVGRMINESSLMEAAMENQFNMHIDQQGFLWITLMTKPLPDDEELTQQLIDRDMRAYTEGISADYVPRRQRYVQ